MEVIRMAKQCSETQLAFFIRELEFPESEYQEFKIGLRGAEDDFTFVDIQVDFTNDQSHETRIVIFNELKPMTVYEVTGKVLYKNEWQIASGGCKYITQPNYNTPFPPNGLHMGGVIINDNSTPNK